MKHSRENAIVATMLLMLLAGILFPSVCRAWHTFMHPYITRTAFENLPHEIKAAFEPYIDTITRESMTPDFFLRDWPNHEWNIHRAPGDDTAAPARIRDLSLEITACLENPVPDMRCAAEKIGLLSHYLADINQPLHTDAYAEEESWIHFRYENDVYLDLYSNEADFDFSSHGITLVNDVYEAVIESAGQANLYYQAIIDAYATAEGYENCRSLTRANYWRAVSDIVDIWTTLWLSTNLRNPVHMELELNQEAFRPGDMLKLALTLVTETAVPPPGDLYVAVSNADGNLWFLMPDMNFSEQQILPFKTHWIPEGSEKQVLVHAPVKDCGEAAGFVVYALLVRAGADPADPGNRLSNLAGLPFRILPLPDSLLDGIRDEPYLFPALRMDSGRVTGMVLQRWDFIFLGEKVDDPATPGDETLLNRLIPGHFRHCLLYLGRDSMGRPSGLELIARNAPYLRLVRFPEAESAYPSGTRLSLPVSIENLKAYGNRWARRPDGEELRKLEDAKDRVLHQIAGDLLTDIDYQMEYSWSGSLTDKEIYLVDDGIANGASCTDYLLNLLEESAGVCIHGSRMTASEIEEYFLSDPQGLLAVIPDEWNPFPFQVTAADIINMGFHTVDPAPHVFSCDSATETGVPVPALLVKSPQFVDIPQVPLPDIYNTEQWGIRDTEIVE